MQQQVKTDTINNLLKPALTQRSKDYKLQYKLDFNEVINKVNNFDEIKEELFEYEFDKKSSNINATKKSRNTIQYIP